MYDKISALYLRLSSFAEVDHGNVGLLKFDELGQRYDAGEIHTRAPLQVA